MELNAPLVSIVIPHFNREKIISEALEGINKQNFKSWECIVVDDGSSEESLKSLRLLLNKYDSQKFFLLQRSVDRKKGANACRNIGVENAKGEFIAFLDSDDSWAKDYLAISVSFAKNHTQFTGSYGGAFIKRNGSVFEMKSRSVGKNEGLFDFLLSPDVVAQTSSYFVFKKCAIMVPFDEVLKRHQDYDFFIRFGRRYGWMFNSISRTHINWSTIDSRVTDFESCITVYNRHSEEFKESRTREGYLISMLGMAYKEKASNKILSFYRQEFSTRGYAKSPGVKLMVDFPFLYRLYKYIFQFK